MSSNFQYRHEIPTNLPAEVMEGVKTLHNFLTLRDVDFGDENSFQGIDLIILCGSAVLETAEATAAVTQIVPDAPVLVCGGFGHSTTTLYDVICSCKKNVIAMNGAEVSSLSEADIMSRYLTFMGGVDKDRITIEEKSTNCGANAQQSSMIAIDKWPHVKKILVLQDPTMMRRSLMCFERFFSKDEFTKLEKIMGYSLSFEEVMAKLPYSFEHYVSLLLGEIPRLRNDEDGYGPNGSNFIDACEIPEEVTHAFDVVRRHYPSKVRQVK